MQRCSRAAAADKFFDGCRLRLPLSVFKCTLRYDNIIVSYTATPAAYKCELRLLHVACRVVDTADSRILGFEKLRIGYGPAHSARRPPHAAGLRLHSLDRSAARSTAVGILALATQQCACDVSESERDTPESESQEPTNSANYITRKYMNDGELQLCE